MFLYASEQLFKPYAIAVMDESLDWQSSEQKMKIISFFNCPLNLPLRNELFVKTKQTSPELKHLDNLYKIAMLPSGT
jgi:hypothetical protein